VQEFDPDHSWAVHAGIPTARTARTPADLLRCNQRRTVNLFHNNGWTECTEGNSALPWTQAPQPTSLPHVKQKRHFSTIKSVWWSVQSVGTAFFRLRTCVLPQWLPQPSDSLRCFDDDGLNSDPTNSSASGAGPPLLVAAAAAKAGAVLSARIVLEVSAIGQGVASMQW
jgi:hypothetical protein